MHNNCINLFYTNKIKNAIIKANSAIASVNANPKIAKRNMSSFKVGFLEVPKINDPKINPIPIPAPASPKVESPAPIFCAACNNIKVLERALAFIVLSEINKLYLIYKVKSFRKRENRTLNFGFGNQHFTIKLSF